MNTLCFEGRMGFYKDILEGIRQTADLLYDGKYSHMAAALGIQQPQVSKILNQKTHPRLDSVAAIMDALGAKVVFPFEKTESTAKDVHFVNPKILSAEEIADHPVDENYLAVPLAAMPVAAGTGMIPEDRIKSWILVWTGQEAVRHRSNLAAVDFRQPETPTRAQLFKFVPSALTAFAWRALFCALLGNLSPGRGLRSKRRPKQGVP